MVTVNTVSNNVIKKGDLVISLFCVLVLVKTYHSNSASISSNVVMATSNFSS